VVATVDTGPLSDRDEYDLQIIAFKADPRKFTFDEIGKKLQPHPMSGTAVWKRWRKIGASEWVQDARNEFAALLPACVHVMRLALLDKKVPIRERLAAARDIAFGLAVLRRQQDISGPGGGPIQFSEAVVVLPDDGSDPDFSAIDAGAENPASETSPPINSAVEVSGEPR